MKFVPKKPERINLYVSVGCSVRRGSALDQSGGAGERAPLLAVTTPPPQYPVTGGAEGAG